MCPCQDSILVLHSFFDLTFGVPPYIPNSDILNRYADVVANDLENMSVNTSLQLVAAIRGIPLIGLLSQNSCSRSFSLPPSILRRFQSSVPTISFELPLPLASSTTYVDDLFPPSSKVEFTDADFESPGFVGDGRCSFPSFLFLYIC